MPDTPTLKLYRSFIVMLLLLFANYCPALAQPSFFSVEEISINSSKRNVEEFVIDKVRDYIDKNADGCWKILKKKRGVNLSKQAKRQAFLNALEDELRQAFTTAKVVGEINLYPKYGLFITHMLGRYIKVHHFNKNPGKANPAQLDIGFVNNKVSFISASVRLVSAYDIWSGFPYDSEQLNKMKQGFSKSSMEFKHSSYRTGSNVCSLKEEPNYKEVFKAYKKGFWNQSFTYTFGPYTQRINNYTCRYTGQNHLTDVNVFIMNEQL